MRTKKYVLLYCADAAAGEQLGLVLKVRCIAPSVQVTVVSSLAGFVSVASATVEGFDCVVVYRTRLGEAAQAGTRVGVDRQICELLRSAKCGGVRLELMNGLPARNYSCAGRLIPAKLPVGMADVVAAVNMASTRKPGPQKKSDARRGFALTRAEIGMVA